MNDDDLTRRNYQLKDGIEPCNWTKTASNHLQRRDRFPSFLKASNYMYMSKCILVFPIWHVCYLYLYLSIYIYTYIRISIRTVYIYISTSISILYLYSYPYLYTHITLVVLLPVSNFSLQMPHLSFRFLFISVASVRCNKCWRTRRFCRTAPWKGWWIMRSFRHIQTS